MANVLITGGSRGIGAACVRRFSQAGHRVWFLYEKEHDAAKAVSAETGATAICADVADGEAVRAAFRECPDVDILVCNAGISIPGLMSMLPEDKWDRLFDVNVKGMYHCINAAMSGFLQKQSGSIVTVSSMWGVTGGSCEAAYSATKGAVIALSKALAKELGPSGIRVNCVCPGVIETDMIANLSEEDKKALAADTPLGRLGTGEDVAELVAFLASNAASFLTGQVIAADGGFAL